LRTTRQLDAVSLLPILDLDSGLNQPRSDAIRIVINSLPLPDDSVPWSELVAFRNESEHVNRLLALRVWTSEMAHGDFSAVEMQERLDYLVNEYETNLRLTRLAAHRGALEVVITTTAEVLEDLVKLRLGKIAKRLFDLRRERVQLMLDEKNVMGRELAYVVHARKAFAKR
jgi:hypothetical protein